MGIETMAIVATATGVLGAGMQVMGQAQQANAAAASASYQAGMMRNQQIIAQRNAEDAKRRGVLAEEQQRLKTGQIIGSQRAALAAQGADINSGSPLDIQTDTARAGELDALTIRSNTAREVYNYQAQAAGAGAQASLLDMQASNATAALPYTIGSTLLGSASSISGKWADWKRKGA